MFRCNRIRTCAGVLTAEVLTHRRGRWRLNSPRRGGLGSEHIPIGSGTLVPDCWYTAITYAYHKTVCINCILYFTTTVIPRTSSPQKTGIIIVHRTRLVQDQAHPSPILYFEVFPAGGSCETNRPVTPAVALLRYSLSIPRKPSSRDVSRLWSHSSV